MKEPALNSISDFKTKSPKEYEFYSSLTKSSKKKLQKTVSFKESENNTKSFNESRYVKNTNNKEYPNRIQFFSEKDYNSNLEQTKPRKHENPCFKNFLFSKYSSFKNSKEIFYNPNEFTNFSNFSNLTKNSLANLKNFKDLQIKSKGKKDKKSKKIKPFYEILSSKESTTDPNYTLQTMLPSINNDRTDAFSNSKYGKNSSENFWKEAKGKMPEINTNYKSKLSKRFSNVNNFESSPNARDNETHNRSFSLTYYNNTYIPILGKANYDINTNIFENCFNMSINQRKHLRTSNINNLDGGISKRRFFLKNENNTESKIFNLNNPNGTNTIMNNKSPNNNIDISLESQSPLASRHNSLSKLELNSKKPILQIINQQRLNSFNFGVKSSDKKDFELIPININNFAISSKDMMIPIQRNFNTTIENFNKLKVNQYNYLNSENDNKMSKRNKESEKSELNRTKSEEEKKKIHTARKFLMKNIQEIKHMQECLKNPEAKTNENKIKSDIKRKINFIISKETKSFCNEYKNKNLIYNDKAVNHLESAAFADNFKNFHKIFRHSGMHFNPVKHVINLDSIEKNFQTTEELILNSFSQEDLKRIQTDVTYYIKDMNLIKNTEALKMKKLKDIIQIENENWENQQNFPKVKNKNQRKKISFFESPMDKSREKEKNIRKKNNSSVSLEEKVNKSVSLKDSSINFGEKGKISNMKSSNEKKIFYKKEKNKEEMFFKTNFYHLYDTGAEKSYPREDFIGNRYNQYFYDIDRKAMKLNVNENIIEDDFDKFNEKIKNDILRKPHSQNPKTNKLKAFSDHLPKTQSHEYYANKTKIRNSKYEWKVTKIKDDYNQFTDERKFTKDTVNLLKTNFIKAKLNMKSKKRESNKN